MRERNRIMIKIMTRTGRENDDDDDIPTSWDAPLGVALPNSK